jgi:hypothetical protein
VICWRLDETASPWANSGNGGTLNLTAKSGSVVNVRQGVFDLSVSNGPSATYGINSGNTSIGQSNSISISAWVYFRTFVVLGSLTRIVAKQYRNDGTWADPYLSVGINMTGSSVGGWQALVCRGAVFSTLDVTDVIDYVLLNEWTLLSITYDASTGVLRMYKNGDLVKSTTLSAANLDWGTSGPWDVAANSNQSGEAINGIVDDVRVANVVRAQAYYQDMYRKGANLVTTY